MREIKLANRYARALFDLAKEKNLVEAIKDDAVLIFNVCKENRDFVLLLQSPVIKDSKKIAIVKDIFEKNLHQLTYKFIIIIARNGREYLIPEIANQIITIYKEYKNIIEAKLVTAVKLDKEIRKQFMSLMEERTKAEIELTEEVDEDLIGGFVLSYDDNQYDASILRQIKNLHREFDINLYIKGF